jgi:predicted glycosyltransferase
VSSIDRRTFKYVEMLPKIVRGCEAGMAAHADCVIGFGMEPALVGAALRRPSVCFTDSEPMAVQNEVMRRLGTCVVTPDCFLGDLGPRHVRVRGYKELAYLHPDRFKPDESVLRELRVTPREPYAVVRFGALRAGHDFRRRGFSAAQRSLLVDRLGRRLKVFVSPEGPPDPVFREKLLPTRPSRIHHVLSFARCLVTDTGTMATEAAVLGTPAIIFGSAVREFGNFRELEEKYDLLRMYDDADAAVEAAVVLSGRLEDKQRCAVRRDRMLADKVDVSEALLQLVIHSGVRSRVSA